LNNYKSKNLFDYRANKLKGDIYYQENNFINSADNYNTALPSARYNDLSVLTFYMHSLKAINNTAAIEQQRKPVEKLLKKYHTAFLANAHFITLGSNVKHFQDLLQLLTDIWPENAKEYSVMNAEVQHHSRKERERLSGDREGMLW